MHIDVALFTFPVVFIADQKANRNEVLEDSIRTCCTVPMDSMMASNRVVLIPWINVIKLGGGGVGGGESSGLRIDA